MQCTPRFLFSFHTSIFLAIQCLSAQETPREAMDGRGCRAISGNEACPYKVCRPDGTPPPLACGWPTRSCSSPKKHGVRDDREIIGRCRIVVWLCHETSTAPGRSFGAAPVRVNNTVLCLFAASCRPHITDFNDKRTKTSRLQPLFSTLTIVPRFHDPTHYRIFRFSHTLHQSIHHSQHVRLQHVRHFHRRPCVPGSLCERLHQTNW